MATVSKGRTFVSGETVTPAKLNELVDNATVTAIQTADISDAQITTAKIADANVTTAKLATVTAQSLLPAGAIMAFARSTAPSGWLEADGAAVSRTDYAALWNALGTTYGSGNGSTTFNLPDLRGIFVRGSGTQTISGITYSKFFSAKEGDALQGHVHGVTHNAITTSAGSGAAGGSGLAFFGATISTGAASTDGSNGTPRVASETRPANIALLYCIKF